MISLKNGRAISPQAVANLTPKTAIAAVFLNKNRIVLFYQTLNFVMAKVELCARLVYKTLTCFSGQVYNTCVGCHVEYIATPLMPGFYLILIEIGLVRLLV